VIFFSVGITIYFFSFLLNMFEKQLHKCAQSSACQWVVLIVGTLGLLLLLDRIARMLLNRSILEPFSTHLPATPIDKINRKYKPGCNYTTYGCCADQRTTSMNALGSNCGLDVLADASDPARYEKAMLGENTVWPLAHTQVSPNCGLETMSTSTGLLCGGDAYVSSFFPPNPSKQMILSQPTECSFWPPHQVNELLTNIYK